MPNQNLRKLSGAVVGLTIAKPHGSFALLLGRNVPRVLTGVLSTLVQSLL